MDGLRQREWLTVLTPDDPLSERQPRWTSSRCVRLLRPLASRLEIVRKGQARGSHRDERIRSNTATSTASCGRSASVGERVSERPQKTGVGHHARTRSIADEEWVPGQNGKQPVRVRYSTKAAARRSHITDDHTSNSTSPGAIPGVVTVATPIIARDHSRRDVEEPINGEEAEAFLDRHGGLRRDRKLQEPALEYAKKFVSPETGSLYGGIHAGLETLLRVTNSRPNLPARSRTADLSANSGAPSLFSTCLRRVADHIKEAERWHETESDYDEGTEYHASIASDVYAELEAISIYGEDGWKPLREVVRSHGVSMLCDAIEGLILHSTFALALVSLCLSHDGKDAAERLLSSLVSACPRLPDPTSTKDSLFAPTTSSTLHCLHEFSRKGLHDGFRYHQMGRLLRNGQMSALWLATCDMVVLWPCIIDHVTQENQTSAEALSFTRIAIAAAHGLSGTPPDTAKSQKRMSPKSSSMTEALNNTVRSVVASLSAIAIYGLRTLKPSPAGLTRNQPALRLLLSLNVDVESALMLREEQASAASVESTIGARRALLVAFAYTFVAVRIERASRARSAAGAQSNISAVLALLARSAGHLWCSDELSDKRSPVNLVAELACSVARCWGRATSDDGFGPVKIVVEDLLHLSRTLPQDTMDKGASSFNEIGLQSAMMFADQSSNGECHGWVREMERRFAARKRTEPSVVKTPRKSAPSYRWEEGLCEWIAVTPSTALARRKSLQRMTKAERRSQRIRGRVYYPSGGDSDEDDELSLDATMVEPSSEASHDPRARRSSQRTTNLKRKAPTGGDGHLDRDRKRRLRPSAVQSYQEQDSSEDELGR